MSRTDWRDEAIALYMAHHPLTGDLEAAGIVDSAIKKGCPTLDEFCRFWRLRRIVRDEAPR